MPTSNQKLIVDWAHNNVKNKKQVFFSCEYKTEITK